MVVTLDGISSRLKPEQPMNADSLIVVTLDEILSCIRPEQQ
jgi:hypothetical protein